MGDAHKTPCPHPLEEAGPAPLGRVSSVSQISAGAALAQLTQCSGQPHDVSLSSPQGTDKETKAWGDWLMRQKTQTQTGALMTKPRCPPSEAKGWAVSVVLFDDLSPATSRTSSGTPKPKGWGVISNKATKLVIWGQHFVHSPPRRRQRVTAGPALVNKGSERPHPEAGTV